MVICEQVEFLKLHFFSRLADIREKQYQEQGIGCYLFGFPRSAASVGEEFVIDATKSGNGAQYANHSCHANMYARVMSIINQKKVLLFARETIQAGDELTLNYRLSRGSPAEERVACLCRHTNCRGFLY